MPKKRKVLLSAYACSPIRGSEEGNGWSWATGLAKRGYHVWCFTNIEDEQEIREAHKKLNLPNLHFVFVRLPKTIEKHFLDNNSKKIYLHYAWWRKRAARMAQRLHRTIKFDIAHHITYGSLQQGHFLWKLKNVKIIFGPVGGGQKALPIFKDYFGKAWRTEVVRNWITRWTLTFNRNFKNSISKADYVLVTNADTMEMAVSAGDSRKIHFVPDNAVPVSMESLPRFEGTKAHKIRLLWVGRMLPRKGLNLVLEAISRLPVDMQYSLTIVGAGEFFHLVPEWIKEYGLDTEKINIVGRVPFEEVKTYYQNSDVFIFCSLRDSFPSQITEAMAFGLPVIALNIHGSAMGVPDNCGIKITPRSKDQTLDDIASAVIKMQNEPDFRGKCSENARKHSADNTWDKRITTVVDQFYET